MTEFDKHIRIALAGNPNSGKTTVFNNITGSRQHVGNYPGVTVEKKEGLAHFDGQDFLFIDLPGTYSLTARSLDEVVARDVIINENPDMIVDVVDASNLERNLYLTVQLLELERPLLLDLNMADVAEGRGITIDIEKLSQRLGCPVVSTVGRVGAGTDSLLANIRQATRQKSVSSVRVTYGDVLEGEIQTLQEFLLEKGVYHYPLRWLAVKLLEGDEDGIEKVRSFSQGEAILAKAAELRHKLATQVDLETVFQEARHHFAAMLAKEVSLMTKPGEETVSDRLDRILTHRVWGLPIFFFTMWALFNIVFEVGAYPQEWLEIGIGALGEWLQAVVPEGNLQSLLVDGIVVGVGGVLSFMPLIVLLFLGISFLEDTGYMARAAFIMDRLMRSFGLHGKSFIPLLLGFGCTVPAIMGARILDNPRDRMATILVAPFMSCGARLPVYTLLIGTFFAPEWSGTILFGIYMLGILLAIICAKLFRHTFFKGDTEPFVMEMPPYHLPTLKSVLIHMWERAWLYIRKAGTFILMATIIVWALLSYPQDVTYSQDFNQARTTVMQMYEGEEADEALQEIDRAEQSEKIGQSYAARFGKFIEPAIEPLGFDWRTGVSLVAGMTAKEVLVSTMATIYAVESDDEDTVNLEEALLADENFTTLTALSLMVFVLIYPPCIAALAVLKRETGSWGWLFFITAYSIGLAWICSFVVYQGGVLFGL